jgi:hypothetical protein
MRGRRHDHTTVLYAVGFATIYPRFRPPQSTGKARESGTNEHACSKIYARRRRALIREQA